MMGIRARLALWFAIVVAVGVAATSTSIYVSTRNELNAGVEAFLVERIRELADGTRALPRARFPNANTERLIETAVDRLPFDPDSFVQAIDEGGAAIASTGPVLPVTEAGLAVATNGSTAVIETVEIMGDDFRVITAPISDVGAVQVAYDLSETTATLRGLRNRSIIIGGAVTILAAFIGWAVTSRSTRALRRLTTAAEHVATTQDLTARIEPEGPDEVGRLSASFDHMLGALRRSQEQQHQLVEDAAHELRTPLTTLQASVELLGRIDTSDDPRVIELTESMQSELGELNHLFDELIELATGAQEETMLGLLDLNDPADQALATFRARSDRNVDATFAGAQVHGNAELLGRAISNLLLNADKFSPRDSAISLRVERGTVEVRDTGPGIAPEDRAKVFDRFYRSDTTRSMPGSGLGLSIVKKIVDQHHGRVFVEEAEGGGAVVGFALPVTLAT